MEQIDPEQVDNSAIFPSDADLAQAHVWRTLTPEEEQRYLAAYQAVING
jgi:spermidine/putrescine transport system substrate-binding protein